MGAVISTKLPISPVSIRNKFGYIQYQFVFIAKRRFYKSPRRFASDYSESKRFPSCLPHTAYITRIKNAKIPGPGMEHIYFY